MSELVYFAEVILRALPVERHRETYSRAVVALVEELEAGRVPDRLREAAEAARRGLETALGAPTGRPPPLLRTIKPVACGRATASSAKTRAP